MSHIFRRKWLTDLLAGCMLALFAAALLITPKTASEAAREGLLLCLDVLIPSLFPFFVVASLVIDLGLARYSGLALGRIMRPLFNLSGPCAAAVILGFFGGYPVGAKCAISLYEKGQCTKEEAERMLAFCNNSGPAFILGAAGAGILGSTRDGWLLFLIHVAASLTVGVLFRFYKRKQKRTAAAVQTVSGPANNIPPPPGGLFTGAVRSSFASVFYISSFVIFFTVVIRLLYTGGVLPAMAEGAGALLGRFGVTAEGALNLLTGLIEVSSGLFRLSGGPQLGGRLAMAAFMLGWAGLSVHCQVLAFIGQSGLSSRAYIAGKFLHASISAVYAYLLASVLTVPAAKTIADQVSSISGMRFWDTHVLTLSVILCAALILMLLAAGALLRRMER